MIGATAGDITGTIPSTLCARISNITLPLCQTTDTGLFLYQEYEKMHFQNNFQKPIAFF